MSATFERPAWDEYFMLQAEAAKLRSNCGVRKVGAVMVRENRLVAIGYNGTPPGIRNCYEGGCERCLDRMAGRLASGEDLERCLCSHAEANAIMHCAIMGIGSGTRDATLYLTIAPCRECTKMAITAGITRFVYTGEYAEDIGGLVKEAGISVTLMDARNVRRWAQKLLGGMA